MKKDWTTSFVKSAGFILLTAALSRFWIAFSDASCLSLPDPVLGVRLQYTVLMVGVVELIIAVICLAEIKILYQVSCLTWLTTNYALFESGLRWMHFHPQTTCTGVLTDPLHLSQGLTGWATAALPLYLLTGCYAALIYLKVQPEKSLAPHRQEGFIKMACVLCDGHIEFPGHATGQKIPCPHCDKPITLLNRPV